jgi:hypothetical protein
LELDQVLSESIAYQVFRWQPECNLTPSGFPLKRILLVEDSRFMRVANDRTLTRAGHEVVTAEDGEQALRLACERVPVLPSGILKLKASSLTADKWKKKIPVPCPKPFLQTVEHELSSPALWLPYFS